MYLIYETETGKVWREVEQYEQLSNGTIVAGMRGSNTLTYPAGIGVSVLGISDETWSAMDAGRISEYTVQNGIPVLTPSAEVTELEQLRADVDYLMVMGGYVE